ncbi:MAG: hypothetical protein WBQ37_04070 [Candidatus Competibacter sp.]
MLTAIRFQADPGHLPGFEHLTAVFSLFDAKTGLLQGFAYQKASRKIVVHH